MRRFAVLTGGLLLLASSASADPAAAPVRTVDDLVELALGGSGQIAEAQGKVEEWRGRLAEVQSLYYPKLSARGWVAPMYRVDRDSVTNDPFKGVDTDWGEWGPYLHLEATLAQPLYTFGRVAAGKDAAEKRLAVEEARARQTRNTVAFEVRKLYYQHLFARSVQPTLANARKILDQALQQGREQYDAGTGKITVVSLQQLEYGSAELDKYIYLARRGEALSLSALKHTIGLPESAELVLADQVLPELESDALPTLPELLQVASRERPEWAQVRSGKQAAISAEAAERLANAPVAFAAGQIRADYTPMRPNASNPYFNDPYNGFWGGIAVGLQWDLDPFRAKARGDAAAGVRVQVEGLEKFASTGIPLEVTKAYGDVLEAQSMLEISERASTAGRKWLTFAGSAYSAGTGDPKAVLEGLASYLQGRRSWYEQLQAVHTARAYLLYATGRTGLEGHK